MVHENKIKYCSYFTIYVLSLEEKLRKPPIVFNTHKIPIFILTKLIGSADS